jgi:hypothetical protein
VKSKEMKTGSDLAESSKEAYGSKRAGFPMTMTHGNNQKMVLTHHSTTHVSTFIFSLSNTYINYFNIKQSKEREEKVDRINK